MWVHSQKLVGEKVLKEFTDGERSFKCRADLSRKDLFAMMGRITRSQDETAQLQRVASLAVKAG